MEQVQNDAKPNVIARIGVRGDQHLCSKNYGAHRDYPKESLYYMQCTTEMIRQLGITHMIGTGDLTYGRFHTLEYRSEVEKQMQEQYRLTNGNVYELKGNHDSATYGMTEYEYYVEQKSLLKPATNLQIGILNISMINYGKHETTEIITPDENKINIVIAHDYFIFNDSQLPNYGDDKAIILDDFEKWFGVDYLILGHIHNYHLFQGLSVKDGIGHDLVVAYLGCMARPAYREGHMQEVGKLLVITVYDNNTAEIDFKDIPLWPIEQSFNLIQKQEEQEKIELKRVDVSDIVKKLDSHERVVGNPEDIIMSKSDIDIRYRNKAVQLLIESVS